MSILTIHFRRVIVPLTSPLYTPLPNHIINVLTYFGILLNINFNELFTIIYVVLLFNFYNKNISLN